MPSALRIAVLLAGGVLLHAAGDAHARKEREERGPPLMPMLQPNGFAAQPRGPMLSPDAAARAIQNRHGGRVLAVQPDGDGYRVKMLKDGEVRIYQVNP